MLLFLLLPAILEPVSFVLSAELADYRMAWIVFAVIQWACNVGLVYAFSSAVFRDFDGLLIVFRKGWTLALVTGFVIAVSQTQNWFDSRGLLLMSALQLGRAITTLVGFALFMLVGLVLYCRVRMTRSVLKVGIGTAVILGIRMLEQFAGVWAYDAHVVRWIYEIDAVLWTGCLTYWRLFLSSNDEVENRTLIRI